MALDPRIALAAQAPNVGQAIGSGLTNVANLDLIGQRREQAPFQNQLLQLQTELAQAQQPGQLDIAAVAASPEASLGRRNDARLTNIATFAPNIIRGIDAGNIDQVIKQTEERKARLIKNGITNTEESDFVLENIRDNPELVKQRSQQAIDQAVSRKLIAAPAQVTQTASSKDFAEFQRLNSLAQESGNPEDLQAAQQFGTQAGFVRPTAQQESQLKIETAQKIATQKALLEGKSAAVKAAVAKGSKAFDQIAPLSTAISNYDDAIAQLDAGANTGFFASIAPSFKAASIKLDNVVKRLGLDVVGNTTFGALSESELKFALQAAIPTNLQPAELKEWLIAKRDAQKKVKERVEEAASFLSDGTHTLKDWIEFDKARQLNIKNQQEQNAAQVTTQPAQATQPAATNQGIPPLLAKPAGVQIGRFTVEEVK